MSSITPENINKCDGIWPNGGPEPARLWTRASGEPCINIPTEELNMRRKAEVLKYTNNSTRQTKNQRFAYVSKRRANNTDGLSCASSDIPPLPASASNVPGNQLLYLNPSIPLTRFITQRQFKGDIGKWPQTTTSINNIQAPI